MDRIESGLVGTLGIGRYVHQGLVSVDGNSYAFTTVGGYYPIGPIYFRAANLLVANAELFDFSTVIDTKLKDHVREMERILCGKEGVVFLYETEEGSYTYSHQDIFDGGLTLGTGPKRPGYFLPWTIGTLIAMQEYASVIQGKTFVDLGSRNALIANASLSLSATQAIVIENDPVKVDFIGWPARERFDLPEKANLVDINLHINNPKAKIRRCYCDFIDMPATLDECVVAYNLSFFGIPYHNHAPEQLGWGASVADLGAYTTLMKQATMESILEDILAKFPNVVLVIAAGGHEGSPEEKLMEDAARLNLYKVGRVPIPVYNRGSRMEGVKPSTFINPTVVFKRSHVG